MDKLLRFRVFSTNSDEVSETVDLAINVLVKTRMSFHEISFGI